MLQPGIVKLEGYDKIFSLLVELLVFLDFLFLMGMEFDSKLFDWVFLLLTLVNELKVKFFADETES